MYYSSLSCSQCKLVMSEVVSALFAAPGRELLDTRFSHMHHSMTSAMCYSCDWDLKVGDRKWLHHGCVHAPSTAHDPLVSVPLCSASCCNIFPGRQLATVFIFLSKYSKCSTVSLFPPVPRCQHHQVARTLIAVGDIREKKTVPYHLS